MYAHAVLAIQPHIVRYYSAWEEDDRMVIQNEFCDGVYTSGLMPSSQHGIGGSLEGVIDQYKKSGRSFTEKELTKILRHTTTGLAALHRQKLAHLDIKPGTWQQQAALLTCLRQHIFKDRSNSAHRKHQ